MDRSATVAAGWWRSTLTNLGRTKPRGARRCLWRKSAEGVVHMADKRAPEFGAPGESLTFSASCRCFEPRKRATVCRIWRSVPSRANRGHAGSRQAPAADQAKGWAFHHAACSRGGARDRGVCPRRKISMIRIGAPQQRHGSRRVSGACSVAVSGAGAGCGTPSKARIFAILALRLALASRP